MGIVGGEEGERMVEEKGEVGMMDSFCVLMG